MPNKYKGPSNKEVFAGFQAMQDQIEEDDYFSGAPMTPQEADQDNQNAAIRSSPESRKISANIASGLRQIPRVSPGYNPKMGLMLKKIQKPAKGGARQPKPQKMVAKINTRKAYES